MNTFFKLFKDIMKIQESITERKLLQTNISSVDPDQK